MSLGTGGARRLCSATSTARGAEPSFQGTPRRLIPDPEFHHRAHRGHRDRKERVPDPGPNFSFLPIRFCELCPLCGEIRNRLAFLVLLLATATACSDDKSYVVVLVSSSPPIANVAQLRVKMTSGSWSEQLLYPDTPRAATALLQLDSVKPVTFSVSLRTSFKDDVALEVQPLDTGGAALGAGISSPQPLNLGQVTYATVLVSPPCDPMAPATICDAGKTCALVCDLYSQPQMLCHAAGQGNPGDPCADTTDCALGSECFDFTTPTCPAQPVKTCRKFCNNAADCGLGSFCMTGVSCGQTSTSLHLCSRPCDPTGDATGGCAAGLLCFIYSGEITDCACLDQSRVGAVGVSCATDADCQPGLMCVDRGGQRNCQTICQLSSPSCPTGKTCTRLTNPDYQVFGACL